MMDALAGWLQQLIAVVLLASLADLLLPGRSMQRYVRLVAGLFVLLAILTPILEWIRGDFASRVMDGLERIVRQPDGAVAELRRIQADGERLRREREDQARLIAAEQLRTAVREAVERAENRKAEDVEIDFMEGFAGAVEVASVRITFSPASVRGVPQAAGNRPIAAIDPVAPVEVRIEPIRPVSPEAEEEVIGRAEKDAAGISGEDAATQHSAAEALARGGVGTAAADSGRRLRADPATESRVAALLAARFGIPAETVQVWEMHPRQTAADRS